MLNSHLLKPETVRAIESLGPQADRIADRWASGWPKVTKAMEAAGTLLPALKEQSEREKYLLVDLRTGGENSHLTDWELLQMYGTFSLLPPGP